MMSRNAVRIWENQYECLKKVPTKKLQAELALAMLDYAFSGKHDALKFPLDAIIQPMYAALVVKNQGGAPAGNNNRKSTLDTTVDMSVNETLIQGEDTTVDKTLDTTLDTTDISTENQPLLNISNKNNNISSDKSSDILLQKKSRVKSTVNITLDDIKAYIAEKNLVVDPETFFNYFTAGDWKDAEGKPVKNWKQKLITWDSRERQRRTVRAAKSLLPKNVGVKSGTYAEGTPL
ncbi:MAG: hypothetical protein J6C85_02385 [Alphaproteobacteria bacterium]|nr:hypothetical protein [Alphaproteobacteria bacterium]